MSPATAAPPRRRTSAPVAPSAPAPRRRPAPPVRGKVTTPRTRPRPTVRNGAPPARTQRVVPPPAPTRRRGRARVPFLVVAAAAVVITIAAFHAMLAQTQVRLEELRARTNAAEVRYEAERLENGRLTSPARITARAAEMGLGPPSAPPVAIPLAGEVPRRGAASATLADWAEVKGHLDASP